MKYTEGYLCLKCGRIWSHEWDTEDYNNDYTQCPECFEDAEFVETTEARRERMSVDYSPILYVGNVFDSEETALDFYQRHFKLSEKDLKDIKADGFVEWIATHPKLSFERTSYYTNDCDYILGFDLSPAVHTPEMFPTAVYNKILEWKEMFGDEPYSIIHDVCVS